MGTKEQDIQAFMDMKRAIFEEGGGGDHEQTIASIANERDMKPEDVRLFFNGLLEVKEEFDQKDIDINVQKRGDWKDSEQLFLISVFKNKDKLSKKTNTHCYDILIPTLNRTYEGCKFQYYNSEELTKKGTGKKKGEAPKRTQLPSSKTKTKKQAETPSSKTETSTKKSEAASSSSIPTNDAVETQDTTSHSQHLTPAQFRRKRGRKEETTFPKTETRPLEEAANNVVESQEQTTSTPAPQPAPKASTKQGEPGLLENIQGIIQNLQVIAHNNDAHANAALEVENLFSGLRGLTDVAAENMDSRNRQLELERKIQKLEEEKELLRHQHDEAEMDAADCQKAFKGVAETYTNFKNLDGKDQLMGMNKFFQSMDYKIEQSNIVLGGPTGKAVIGQNQEVLKYKK